MKMSVAVMGGSYLAVGQSAPAGNGVADVAHTEWLVTLAVSRCPVATAAFSEALSTKQIGASW